MAGFRQALVHCISIHALLAESDQNIWSPQACARDFYPRSPCGERRCLGRHQKRVIAIFLSTLSLRRATACVRGVRGGQQDFYPRSPCGERRPGQTAKADRKNFYPRSPCGERLDIINNVVDGTNISIHALLAESDVVKKAITFYPPVFLSTLSLRRATIGPLIFNVQPRNFYPRSPCGERHFPAG